MEQELIDIEKIDEGIKLLKQKKRELINLENNQSIRIRNNSGNTLNRVSNNFAEKIEKINEKREENGLNKMSFPKITELIIKHKIHWKPLEEDLIFYDTEIEEEGALYEK